MDQALDRQAVLEALLFVAEEPLSLAKLQEILGDEDPARTEASVRALALALEAPTRGLMVQEVAGGFRLATRAEAAPWIQKLQQVKPARLSRAALETLAIIAYKQPITRAEIEAIRGVAVDGVMRTLLERGLVRMLGRKAEAGRPILYGTSGEFLEHFGFKELGDLPTLREIDELIGAQKPEATQSPAEPPAPAADAEPPPADGGQAGPADSGTPAGRPEAGPAEPERLQKFLARAGLASRRHCEELILAGRVRVNGEVVRVLGTRVRPALDRVQVDGEIVRPDRLVTLLLHKPAGYITSLADPQGRPVVTSLLPPGEFPRLFPVGRLDWDTEGLLLLTNDGALAHALTHPRFHVPRVYHAKVRGRPAPEALQRLRQGIVSEGEHLSALAVEVLRTTPHNAWLAVSLGEGRNRQVRRMCEAVGHPVLRLIRVSLGPLRLGELPRGAWRSLAPAELASLKALVARTAARPDATASRAVPPPGGAGGPGPAAGPGAGGRERPLGRTGSRAAGGEPAGNAPRGRPRERAPSGRPRERA